jgi:Trk K+ transport system NAD-binding subunit
MTQETLVLGGGPIGLELAAELAAQDRPVSFVDGERMAERARRAGLIAHESTLETAPSVERSASTVVVATPSDARNLLLAAAAPRAFDAERVIALVNDPDRQAAFEDIGVETVCVSRTLARVTTDSIGVAELSAADRAAETDGRAAEADGPVADIDGRVRRSG